MALYFLSGSVQVNRPNLSHAQIRQQANVPSSVMRDSTYIKNCFNICNNLADENSFSKVSCKLIPSVTLENNVEIHLLLSRRTIIWLDSVALSKAFLQLSIIPISFPVALCFNDFKENFK